MYILEFFDDIFIPKEDIEYLSPIAKGGNAEIWKARYQVFQIMYKS